MMEGRVYHERYVGGEFSTSLQKGGIHRKERRERKEGFNFLTAGCTIFKEV